MCTLIYRKINARVEWHSELYQYLESTELRKLSSDVWRLVSDQFARWYARNAHASIRKATINKVAKKV